MNHEHIEQDLTKMKRTIEQAKDMRYRAEAKLEELENQEKRLLAELDEYTGEQALEIAEALVRSGAVDIIVVGITKLDY